MKVILIKDVKGTGKKDEIKEVKDGFGNYLVKTGSAVIFSEKSLEKLNSEIDLRASEEKELINDMKKIKEKLESLELVFKLKTGSNGKVFGSISTKQIYDSIKNSGIEVDKKKIVLDTEINSLGTFNVKVLLHKEVSALLRVKVVGE